MIGRLLQQLRRGPAPDESSRPRNAYCSFCRRSHTDVGPLAEGSGLVFICGECVGLCGVLIAEENARRAGVPAAAEPVAALVARLSALEAEVARLREAPAAERPGPPP